jgi:hypothetical protein
MANSFAYDRRRCRNRRVPFVFDKKDRPAVDYRKKEQAMKR